MNYLECMALLSYVSKKLCAGQRMQVPVSVLDEMQTSLISLRKRLEKEEDPMMMNKLNDLMIAVNDIKKTNGLISLTDNMKQVCVDGVRDLADDIAIKAFYYFKTHEFEPTQQIIPIMRRVVEVALERGEL